MSLLAQASVFVQAKKTLAYFKICKFPINYESVMFYDTDSDANLDPLIFNQRVTLNKLAPKHKQPLKLRLLKTL